MANPAIEYWPNGNKKREYWSEGNFFHRVGGPAIQRWHENGQLAEESWINMGADIA